MTKTEYIQELIEEVVSAALDFGHEPTEPHELALAEASELLYNAVEGL